jgi:hypothetical protein
MYVGWRRGTYDIGESREVVVPEVEVPDGREQGEGHGQRCEPIESEGDPGRIHPSAGRTHHPLCARGGGPDDVTVCGDTGELMGAVLADVG